ncbi:MAG: flagellar export chaperone FliS [Gammaproteobacteria bacterium]|jgi:flagellar protein FliS|nr:flagellar export chaperone FliS [Gammaproteobacteria bacterium]MBT3725084.1 flagellar export chaperone FliS [Gammaproteobacteria bacterium]MBT4076113.1 flagellar export chaperone FliS [Gammaproteobacteria bacterium]MBT4194400.1 flagellar export chaperone FliS [Gammaproteobacteria bacterium]MBT4448456.1 flagellar export chaperone FliS [Gammaproteobacteria bacterium]
MNQYTKAYSSTATYSGVAYADPHSLITQMFDGALKRIAQARGCLERKEYAAKGENISHAIAIIGSLEGCLNLEKGGELATNLSSLYEYMVIKLAEANVNNDTSKLNEVISLILEIKSAWVQIAPHQTQKAG